MMGTNDTASAPAEPTGGVPEAVSAPVPIMDISEADLLKAATDGHLDIVNQAIDQGVNINCTDVRHHIYLLLRQLLISTNLSSCLC